MTISELAKIALDEGRVVKATCAAYDAKRIERNLSVDNGQVQPTLLTEGANG